MPTPKAAPQKNGDTYWNVRYRDAAGNSRHRTFLEEADAQWFCDQIEHRGPSFAEKQLRDVEREAERAGERASTPALDKVAADFFRWKRAYVRAGETVDAYERHYANHIQPTLGAHPIGTINSYDVDDWVEAMVVGTIKNSRTGKGLSPKTIAARHALLHSIMEYAASPRRRIIDVNPCKGKTELPKRVRPTPKGLRLAQWQALHANLLGVGETDAADLAAFLIGAGWRAGEAMALQVGSVEDYGSSSPMWVSMDRVLRVARGGSYIVDAEGAEVDAPYQARPHDGGCGAAPMRRQARR